MKLTKETLYRLILEAIEDDPNPRYAELYDPTKPMALYHDDKDTAHSFYLYHLTDDPDFPIFVIAYLAMEVLGDDDKKCIPHTFHVLGTYTELKARRRGFSRTLYDIAFYMASKYKNRQGDTYGLTSDQYSGTTDVADIAAWAKYEQSGNYYKRETTLGNNKFDYTGKLCGYSDHACGISYALFNIAEGASIIEKHFTLNKGMDGNDHIGSMDVNELKILREYGQELCTINAILPDREININDVISKSKF